MRLLYLIDSLAGGGAESVLANLVNYLAQHEPQVTCEVATLYPTAGKYLAGKNFAIHCLGLDSKYDFRGWERLKALVSKNRYDVVHTHLFPANYYAAAVLRHFPASIWLYTEHNVWNRRRRFPALRMVENVVYARFRRIIAVSELVAASLRRWLPSLASKVVMIPNGVPMSAFQQKTWCARDLTERTVLFAGRLEYVKGVDILLRAFAKFPSPTTLLLAGDGAQRETLERLTLDLELSSSVKFLGFRSDIAALMREADCVVLPSRWEGLPMVMLEAMALGTPVIASAVGGIPEVIEDDITGWLVPPEDVDSLAGALLQALTDTEKAQRIAVAAHARIKTDYSVEVLARRTLALYHQLLNNSE